MDTPMVNFAKIATQQTTLSPLMEGREKIKTRDVIRAFPEGITVTEFDFVNVKNKQKQDVTVPVIVFKEDRKSFFFGGTVLMKICQAWVNAFGGDVEKTSDELSKAGGVKMILRESETKAGDPMISVEVLN